MPTRYRLGASCLGLFATLMQFGTPDDLTVDEIEIELYFPADEASAQLLRAMGVDRA